MEVAVLAASFTFTNVIITKMGIQQDPMQVCGYPFPVSFLQMLASTLVVDDSGNVLGFRVTLATPVQPCDCNPYIDCDKTGMPPESIVVLGFGLDECGKLAIKLVNCDGTSDGDRPQ